MTTRFSTPANYYWGELFRRFFGGREWKNLMSEAASVRRPVYARDFRFSNGEVLSRKIFSDSTGESFVREFSLLLTFPKTYEVCKLCGVAMEQALSGMNRLSDYNVSELNVVDVKTVGCKFNIQTVTEFVKKLNGNLAEPSLVEHCWSLSNSCGELINPKDTKRFVSLIFKGKDVIESTDEAIVSSSYLDYLSHCLNLYETCNLSSNSGKKALYDEFLKYVIAYLETSDLEYHSPSDNPLVAGVLYDMCFEYNTLKSTYLKNIESFDCFLSLYLPLLSEIFSMNWEQPAPDVRLLFELDTAELLLKIPTINTLDSTFLYKNKLRYLESYFEDDSNELIKVKVDSLLTRDNPELKLAQRWVGFHCYYGVFRTAQTRKVKRDAEYKPCPALGEFTINMSGVEEFFDELQKKMPSVSVRRRFCGSLSHEAFSIFKRFGVGFPPITRLNVPVKYSYLNVDYYRHVKRAGLTQDELTILSNIEFDVAEMCCEREVALQARRAQRREKPFQGWKGVKNEVSPHARSSIRVKKSNESLLNILWKDVGVRRQGRLNPLHRKH
uniref:(isolate German BYV-G) genes for putative membrane-binding protein, heat shock 70-related protein, coat protein homolog and coat protein n=1 Tax=Beet yellows virus TaxID=12161 RepID=Q65895_9CLOS|nr:unnamed protein product [Beet yellows virus]